MRPCVSADRRGSAPDYLYPAASGSYDSGAPAASHAAAFSGPDLPFGSSPQVSRRHACVLHAGACTCIHAYYIHPAGGVRADACIHPTITAFRPASVADLAFCASLSSSHTPRPAPARCDTTTYPPRHWLTEVSLHNTSNSTEANARISSNRTEQFATQILYSPLAALSLTRTGSIRRSTPPGGSQAHG